MPDLDFTDSSGEARDQSAEHAEHLALFAETLRAPPKVGAAATVPRGSAEPVGGGVPWGKPAEVLSSQR